MIVDGVGQLYGDEEGGPPVDVEGKVDRFLKGLQSRGQPGSRADWQKVIAHLICLPDEYIRLIARKGPRFNVEWLSNVAAAILEELAAGRAVRTADGAITLVAAPKAKGLQVLR